MAGAALVGEAFVPGLLVVGVFAGVAVGAPFVLAGAFVTGAALVAPGFAPDGVEGAVEAVSYWSPSKCAPLGWRMRAQKPQPWFN